MRLSENRHKEEVVRLKWSHFCDHTGEESRAGRQLDSGFLVTLVIGPLLTLTTFQWTNPEVNETIIRSRKTGRLNRRNLGRVFVVNKFSMKPGVLGNILATALLWNLSRWQALVPGITVIRKSTPGLGLWGLAWMLHFALPAHRHKGIPPYSKAGRGRGGDQHRIWYKPSIKMSQN